MNDFLVALGLVLVIEGLVFSIAPGFAKEAMKQAAETPAERMRLVGIVSAVIGVGIVWLIKRGMV
jgi:uncharacterized protein